MALPNLLRLVYRNIKVNTDYGTLIILIGLPAMYLVFFGFGFQSLLPPNTPPHLFLSFLTPGMMAYQTVMAGTVGGSMLWADRRYGMLAQLLVGPFTRLEYLLGIMLTTVLFGLAGAAVLFFMAYALIGSLTISLLGVATITSAILVGSIFFGSLMLFLSAMVKSNNAYNSIQILIIFVVSFASTVFYTDSPKLPLAMKALLVGNPLTYFANVARDGYMATMGMADAYTMVGLVAVTFALLYIAVRSYMRSGVSFS